ncbi:MAG: hypothetical protein CMD66_04160 [Gammaproteobacteria bacterium]|nr:hypothetical protein [Gammaproteobacteria bacterium]
MTLSLRYLAIFLVVLGLANQDAHGCAFNFKKHEVKPALDQNDQPVESPAKNFVAEDPNETTSRFVRNNYMCQVGDNPSLRPPEADDKKYSSIQFGFAHLDNDDRLDLIQGFMTEARNEYDVRSTLDYKLHMSSGEWTGPPVKALLARKMLVQDFNRDGKDDVVLLSTGNHKPPLKGLKNTILLSGQSGYTYSNLPGGSYLSHGGAAGDLDQDGDIDVVVANGTNKTVQLLVNSGSGKFKAMTFLNKHQHRADEHLYTAEVWDLDADGFLDIVLASSNGVGMVIFWGERSEKDRPVFSKKQRFKPEVFADRLPLDMAFGDFDGDGFDEMATIDTRGRPNRYRGWGIVLVDFDGTRNPVAKSVYDEDPGQNYHWHGWIDACDVNKNGLIDLSAQILGVAEKRLYPNVGKIEWINTGTDQWTQRVINRDELIPTKPDQFQSKESVKYEPKRETRIKSGPTNPSFISRQVPTKEVCKYAIRKNDWNKKEPLWVEEAKSRGLSIAFCERAIEQL